MGVKCGSMAGASKTGPLRRNDTPKVGTESRERSETSTGPVDEYVSFRHEREGVERELIRVPDSDKRSLPQAGRDGETEEHQDRNNSGEDDRTSRQSCKRLSPRERAGSGSTILRGGHWEVWATIGDSVEYTSCSRELKEHSHATTSDAKGSHATTSDAKAQRPTTAKASDLRSIAFPLANLVLLSITPSTGPPCL